MYANPESNQFNTIAVRASYILSILKRFLWRETRKTGGVVYLPRKKTKTETSLSFWVLGKTLKTGKVSLKSVRSQVARPLWRNGTRISELNLANLKNWTLQTLRIEPCKPWELNLANLKNWTLQTLRIEPCKPWELNLANLKNWTLQT